jgi:ATP-dependent protease HslVU (ClpYQ) peptidase subunit
MKLHGTTILAVRHKGKAAVAGDGQVTLKDTVIKHRAKKKLLLDLRALLPTLCTFLNAWNKSSNVTMEI